MSDDVGDADNSGVVAPPPLIFAGTLAFGLLVNRLRPAAFLPRRLGRAVGLTMLVGGLSIGLSGFRELRWAGTNVDSREPSTAIVTDGPYRFTRNPLYLSMALTYAGVASLANALPAVLLLPAVLAVMQKGVIEREERYLERKFGDEYIRYKERVRRWI